MRFKVTGSAMNGQRDYSTDVFAATTADEAKSVFLGVVTDFVRKEYGGNPRGISWLCDPRTVVVEEVK